MKPGTKSVWIATTLGWVVALLMFFPVFWMALAAFKTEQDAYAIPPKLFFTPTLENFAEMNQRVNYVSHASNSVLIAFATTIIGILITAPAAFSMAFYPTKRTKSVLLWMLSTKFMPAVGVLMPIYLILASLRLIDTRTGLIGINLLSNLPLIVWMLYSYFKEVPIEILEAGRMDGARALTQLRYLLLPLAAPGIFSTALLSIILAWNESFWCINVTAAKAGTLALAIASFSNPEGLFWAKLSAASLASVGPILVFGWMTQRQLVRGLTFGAVK